MLAAAVEAPARRISTHWMHILHVTVRGDTPALDRIHVIEQHAGRIERSTFGDQLLVCWLRIAGLVGRSALQSRRRSVPQPWKAEAGLADRQHRILQRGKAPGLT